MPRTMLERALSKLGYASRRQAEQWIRAGRVRVGGRVVRDPKCFVELDPEQIVVEAQTRPEPVYWMLNKPRGLVTTAADERDRPTVYRCLPPTPWVAPAGRLDQASEGLLLLSNDPRWTAAITDPTSHLDKIYHVQIDRPPSAALLEQLRLGRRVDGEWLAVKQAAVLRSHTRTAWLELTLDQGRYRHLRRLLGALELEVLRLVRVAIGPLTLGGLAKGAWRALEQAELEAIDAALHERRNARRQGPSSARSGAP